MDPHATPRPSASRHFRVGPWTVDPGAHTLVRDDGATVRVEPKVMGLLVVLAEADGATVSRETLLETVWPGVVVTEDALSRAVSKLRTALGDRAQTPAFVETIPKGGYRLIAAVERRTPSPAAPVRRRRGAWAVGLATLAVLVAALVVGAVASRRGGSTGDAPRVRPLTHLPGVEAFPSLSPDGQRLAFVAAPRDSADAFDLFVQGLDDATPRRLLRSSAAERHPAWLPGDRLAVLQCVALRCEVVVTAATGGAVPRRASPTPVGPWGLGATPGGRLVAAARPAPEQPYRLVEIDPDDGAHVPLTTPPPASDGDLLPAVAPDGRHVAFLRHDAHGQSHLMLQRLAPGAPARALVADVHGLAGIAWTADDALVYTASRDGRSGLWTVGTDGAPPRPHPLVPTGSLLSLAAGPAGLVVETRTVEINLYTASASDPAPRVVVAGTSADDQPHLHPAGSHVAFVSDRSGSANLWTVRLDGTGPTPLTRFDGARVGAPRWSPDGRRIAFEVQDSTSGAIYVVGADGSGLRRLSPPGGYDYGPRWTPDGTAVVIGSNRGGRAGVWHLDARSAALRPLGRGMVGERLAGGALVVHRSDGLVLRRNGIETVLDPALSLVDWGSWSVVDGGVVVPRRTADAVDVVRVPLGGGGGQRLARLPPTLPQRSPALSVSADGRRRVWAQRDRVESVLLRISG